jgi:Uma2 family endonuclease
MTAAIEPRTKRWNKSEYRSLLDWAGVDRLRYELIDGEIIEMPPQTDMHAFALTLVDYALREVFGAGFVVRLQSPLDLSRASEPEPDLAVIKGQLRDVRKHPRKAELIIEIAWGSLAYDRNIKGSLYASRGIREYWIVNLHDFVLEVRRRPAKDSISRFGSVYAETKVLEKGDVITPLATPRAKLKVSDLLP